MLSACTIIAGNYLPFARVLARSFLAHHEQSSFTVLVIDRRGETNVPAFTLTASDARITSWTLEDLGLDRREIHHLAGIYDVTELATAVKPLLLQRLLDRGDRTVIYLDPDIQVFDSLEAIAVLAAEHGIVLTPHTTVPFPKDGLQVDDYFVLAAGVYNLGFIGVGPSSRPFLEWWWQVTRREALSDVSRNMFTDQRWVDFVPSFFDHVLLKDPGYNVAYWNLHGREVTFDGARYVVNGEPLRFFHFSGFDPRNTTVLSKHQGDRPRIQLGDRPALATLCQAYAARLLDEGMGVERPSYGWSRTANGLEVTTRMRRLYRDGLLAAERGRGAEPPDPFDRASPEAFLAWLNAPDMESVPVSRYLRSIYRERLDLQIQFPEVEAGDTSRFTDWIWQDNDLRETTPMELLPLAAAPRPTHPTTSSAPSSAGELDVSAAKPLEAIAEHLETMNVLRASAENKSFPGVRLAAQQFLFRVLRPYAFQQQQFNTQLIAGLRQAAAALRREEHLREVFDTRVREVTRELIEVKRELRRVTQEQGPS